MRIVLIAILCTSSVCLTQGNCHNDEFGFTIEVPAGWNVSFEDEWSDKIKTTLEKKYSFKSLAILNPSGIESFKIPFILVQGNKLKRTTTSEAITELKKNGK